MPMKTSERKVYEAVYRRAIRQDEDGTDYPACERCGHNGTKYRLEMAHKVLKGQGGETTEENVRYWCYKCHREHDHHDRIM